MLESFLSYPRWYLFSFDWKMSFLGLPPELGALWHIQWK